MLLMRASTSMVLPVFILAVFIESLEVCIFLHFWQYPFSWRLTKGTVPAFLNFQIAAGDRSCFIFSNRDGMFLTSCSLAALIQPTRMRMPHVASGRGGVILCC